jgi:hypothetical protein
MMSSFNRKYVIEWRNPRLNERVPNAIAYIAVFGLLWVQGPKIIQEDINNKKKKKKKKKKNVVWDITLCSS